MLILLVEFERIFQVKKTLTEKHLTGDWAQNKFIISSRHLGGRTMLTGRGSVT